MLLEQQGLGINKGGWSKLDRDVKMTPLGGKYLRCSLDTRKQVYQLTAAQTVFQIVNLNRGSIGICRVRLAELRSLIQGHLVR